MVSRCFSKAEMVRLLLMSDVPVKLLELVLHSHTFFTQELINCIVMRLQEPLSEARLSADWPCMHGKLVVPVGTVDCFYISEHSVYENDTCVKYTLSLLYTCACVAKYMYMKVSYMLVLYKN